MLSASRRPWIEDGFSAARGRTPSGDTERGGTTVANNVVAHLNDGSLVKGTTLNLELSKPTFHVRMADGRMRELQLNRLKALFFVKDLAGDPAYREKSKLSGDDPRRHGSRGIEIVFKDGERFVGLTNRYPPVGPYFFVLPADPNGNNIRILVNRAEVASLREHPAAGGDLSR
jgi:hypothetical protein